MKALRGILLITLIAGGAPHTCYGQMTVDNDLIDLFEVKDSSKQDYSSAIRESTNDISTLVSVGFLFYKSFISSQDNPSCVFTPSCSEFAVQSIQKSGFILGWLTTFDRLSRCHGLVNHHHYPFDTEKRRYHDPVH